MKKENGWDAQGTKGIRVGPTLLSNCAQAASGGWAGTGFRLENPLVLWADPGLRRLGCRPARTPAPGLRTGLARGTQQCPPGESGKYRRSRIWAAAVLARPGRVSLTSWEGEKPSSVTGPQVRSHWEPFVFSL